MFESRLFEKRVGRHGLPWIRQMVRVTGLTHVPRAQKFCQDSVAVRWTFSCKPPQAVLTPGLYSATILSPDSYKEKSSPNWRAFFLVRVTGLKPVASSLARTRSINWATPARHNPTTCLPSQYVNYALAVMFVGCSSQFLKQLCLV